MTKPRPACGRTGLLVSLEAQIWFVQENNVLLKIVEIQLTLPLDLFNNLFWGGYNKEFSSLHYLLDIRWTFHMVHMQVGCVDGFHIATQLSLSRSVSRIPHASFAMKSCRPKVRMSSAAACLETIRSFYEPRPPRSFGQKILTKEAAEEYSLSRKKFP